MKNTYTLEDLRDWKKATSDLTSPAILAVLGDPVAHSASPQMHNPALADASIDSSYVRLHILPEELEEALGLLPAAGFVGVNVTIPHKAEVMKLVDHLDPHAKLMGAVNTVLVGEDGKLHGFSTDGPGFVRAVREEFSMDLSDLRVMVLGAGGGAGRSIAVQCALEGCEHLVLVNRTLDKAEALAEELRNIGKSERLEGPTERVDVVALDSPRLKEAVQSVDLIVNATSLGMKRTDPEVLPASYLQPSHCIYDTVYVGGKSKLLVAADEAGARGANGLSMLLHQGALSFEIWFNQLAPVEVMRKGLDDAMGRKAE